MIIGLSGKLGTGKTTVADALMDLLPGSRRLSFAAELKRMASELYNYPLEWNYSGKDKVVSLLPDLPAGAASPSWNGQATVREILQYYGTDVARARDPDFWVKTVERRICEGEIAIIDDVRFPNERDLAMRKGFCFRIEPYPGYRAADGHASETALDGAEFTEVFRPEFGREHLIKVAREIAAYAWIRNH